MGIPDRFRHRLLQPALFRMRERTSGVGERTSGVRRTPFAALIVGALHSCGHASSPGADAGAASDVTRANALLTQDPLPARPEVIAVAQSVEALALKEGAGARAVELHALAAKLEERVWRLEHREQDAKEAIDLYRAASKDLALNGACDAGGRGALLGGEVAKNAETTYAELYRVQRRSNGGPCAKTIEPLMASLNAFRPDAKVLDAIDRGLAGEGAIAMALLDAGPSRVSVAPHVQKIEQWGGPEAARVVVHLDRSANFRVNDSRGETGVGARTSVELDGVELGTTPRRTAIGGIVTQVVASPTTTGTTIALDLSGPGYRRVFHLLEPFRIVIDIAKQPPGTDPKTGARTVARVAVDAGHGGNDPGAKGPTGVQEKDITLAVAHKLAPILAKHGLQVALTRDDDRYVTLEERTARANAFGADLFISIHCNAAERTAKRGVETYVLDTTTSDMAGRVAARENATSQAASNEVAQLLASMRLADQATRSTRLAELLQRSAVVSLNTQFNDITDGGLHRAAFYVLVGARMPAVLFETSYISNPIEEQRLASADYQQRLADGIANAVKAYREGR
jgi:N-acetylmuramoyl-L-alanine amidase